MAKEVVAMKVMRMAKAMVMIRMTVNIRRRKTQVRRRKMRRMRLRTESIRREMLHQINPVSLEKGQHMVPLHYQSDW